MAVVMALQEYEFQPQTTIPHGRVEIDSGAYEVRLNVPIRERVNAARENESAIRVGPSITMGMQLRSLRPVYPEFARENRIQGEVAMEIMIGKEGYVERMKTSGGPFALIEAAQAAVRQWTFRPYLLNREPIEWLTEIKVNFALR